MKGILVYSRLHPTVDDDENWRVLYKIERVADRSIEAGHRRYGPSRLEHFLYRDLRLRSRFAIETLEHSMTLHAVEERKSHACASRTRVETFSHNFRTQILLSALEVRFIYTHIHVHIFSYVSPFIEEQIHTRSNVSLESTDIRFPDLHFDKSGERLKANAINFVREQRYRHREVSPSSVDYFS